MLLLLEARSIQGVTKAGANLPKASLLQAVLPKPKVGLLPGAGRSQPKSVLELQAESANPGPGLLTLLLLLLEAPKPPVPEAGMLLAGQESAGLLLREASPKPVTGLLLEVLWKRKAGLLLEFALSGGLLAFDMARSATEM